jgi:hypothetical protein
VGFLQPVRYVVRILYCMYYKSLLAFSHRVGLLAVVVPCHTTSVPSIQFIYFAHRHYPHSSFPVIIQSYHTYSKVRRPAPFFDSPFLFVSVFLLSFYWAGKCSIGHFSAQFPAASMFVARDGE